MNSKIKIFLSIFLILIQKPDCAFSQHQSKARLQYLSPLPCSEFHNLETGITIRYGVLIDRNSINNDLLKVVGELSGIHYGSLKLNEDQITLSFVPIMKFAYNEKVTVSLKSGIKSKTGELLPDIYYWFRTREEATNDIHQVADRPYEDIFNSNKKNKESTGSINISFNNLFFSKIFANKSPSTGNILTAIIYHHTEYFHYLFTNEGVPLYVKKTKNQIFNLKPQLKGVITYFDFTEKGFIAIDSNLTVVDTFRLKNGYSTDAHEIQILENGHVFMMGYDPQIVNMSQIVSGGNQYATVTGLVIQELDENDNLVFQWRSWDHIKITDSYIDLTTSTVDYVHGNSINVDSDSTLIISTRNLCEITKINRLNGKIVWRLGGKNNEFTFINDSRGFSMQHSAEKLKNGNLILFDNGVNLNPEYSRGLEYELDEINKKVKLVHEFRHVPDASSSVTGNIQRISNGNTIIYWGSDVGINGTLISEFDSLSNLIFDASFELELGPSYRATRTDWKPYLFTFNNDTLNYHQVYIGTKTTKTFDVINQSNKLISITSVHNKNKDINVDAIFPIQIQPKERKTLSVDMLTSKLGSISDTLNVCYETDSLMVNRQLFVFAESTSRTGLNQLLNKDFRVYPNPGNGIYHVDVFQNGHYRFQLFDLKGITIWRYEDTTPKSFNIDITDKPNGLFILSIENLKSSERSYLKILKMN